MLFADDPEQELRVNISGLSGAVHCSAQWSLNRGWEEGWSRPQKENVKNRELQTVTSLTVTGMRLFFS